MKNPQNKMSRILFVLWGDYHRTGFRNTLMNALRDHFSILSLCYILVGAVYRRIFLEDISKFYKDVRYKEENLQLQEGENAGF